jgi:hypothetical protein
MEKNKTPTGTHKAICEDEAYPLAGKKIQNDANGRDRITDFLFHFYLLIETPHC